MSTLKLKEQILALISKLFGDLNADEEAQVTALEEIASAASDNAEVLRLQIKDRATE